MPIIVDVLAQELKKRQMEQADPGFLGSLLDGMGGGEGFVKGFTGAQEKSAKEEADRRATALGIQLEGVKQGQTEVDPASLDAYVKDGSAIIFRPSDPNSPAAKKRLMEMQKSEKDLQKTDAEIRKLNAEAGKAGRTTTDELVPKQNQAVAATYATRGEQAEQELSKIMGNKFDPTSRWEGLKNTLTPEMFKGADRKQYDQAQANFVSAVLRKESGAAIPPEELEAEKRKYFPQPGDSDELIAQKARTRAAALAGLRVEAGPAYGAVRSSAASAGAFNIPPPASGAQPQPSMQSKVENIRGVKNAQAASNYQVGMRKMGKDGKTYERTEAGWLPVQ